MSDNAPSIPLFTDAYLADTRHLTLEEHGAYLQLMMIAWRSTNCLLPNDDKKISRMLGITAGHWSKLKPTVMSFWKLTDDGWQQKRLSKEREFVEKKREQNSRASKLRWNSQPIENIESVECKRISKRNAPPPPPNKAAKAASENIGDDEGIVCDVAHKAGHAAGLSNPEPGKIIEAQTIVRGWIKAGADPDLITSIIAARMAGGKINPRSLRYFDGAVREALEARPVSGSVIDAGTNAMVDSILGRG